MPNVLMCVLYDEFVGQCYVYPNLRPNLFDKRNAYNPGFKAGHINHYHMILS